MGSLGVLTGIGVKVGLAVALALGATAAARSLHLARYGWRPGRGALRVVETAALGQNRALHLVRVGKRTLFLASTPSQIVMLADVTAEQEAAAEEVSGEAGAARGAVAAGLDFASLLRRVVASGGGLVSGLKSRRAEELAGMGMPALQRTAGAGDTLLPYDSGTARRPEDRAPTGAAGDRAERLLAAARMLRGEGARGWVG